MTKRFGFTLAEVLITLGIIGVVAAMTMPTLMNQTNGAQYKAGYKKALSAISQAVTLNVALDDYNFADLTGDTTGNGTVATLLKNRMNVVREEVGSGNVKLDSGNAYSAAKAAQGGGGAALSIATGNTTLFFNDGIMFSFPTAAKECKPAGTGVGEGTPCKGFIDVNGTKAPNKEVSCDAAPSNGTCTVKSPTDVYPVIFYDQTILPSTVAAKAVLYGK